MILSRLGVGSILDFESATLVGIADGFHHVKKSIDVRSIQNI